MRRSPKMLQYQMTCLHLPLLVKAMVRRIRVMSPTAAHHCVKVLMSQIRSLMTAPLQMRRSSHQQVRALFSKKSSPDLTDQSYFPKIKLGGVALLMSVTYPSRLSCLTVLSNWVGPRLQSLLGQRSLPLRMVQSTTPSHRKWRRNMTLGRWSTRPPLTMTKLQYQPKNVPRRLVETVPSPVTWGRLPFQCLVHILSLHLISTV